MRGILTFVYRDICEYVCLYTADGFEGEMTSCNEGELKWVPKDKLLTLNLFEGDLIFFKLLLEDAPFFSLKLTYDQVNEHRLIDAKLNGKKLELFDILDENGVPTGLTRERSLCHLLDTPHRTGHVWIVRPVEAKDKIASDTQAVTSQNKPAYELLLQKRSHDKDSFPDCYDISSAGHVPAGSSVLDSAIRELSEELGIKLRLTISFLLAHMKETATVSFMESRFTTMNLVHCISTQNLCSSKILCCRSQKSSQ